MHSFLELVQLSAAEEKGTREVFRQLAILEVLNLVHLQQHDHIHLVQLCLFLPLEGQCLFIDGLQTKTSPSVRSPHVTGRAVSAQSHAFPAAQNSGNPMPLCQWSWPVGNNRCSWLLLNAAAETQQGRMTSLKMEMV